MGPGGPGPPEIRRMRNFSPLILGGYTTMDVISLYSLDWNIDENIIISKNPGYREAPAGQKKFDIIKKSWYYKKKVGIIKKSWYYKKKVDIIKKSWYYKKKLVI